MAAYFAIVKYLYPSVDDSFSLFQDVALQSLKVGRAIAGSLRSLTAYGADFHVLVDFERYRYDGRPIQLNGDHARANGVAIQPYEQVKQGGTVAHADVLGTVERGGKLFGIVKRVIASLFVGKGSRPYLPA